MAWESPRGHMLAEESTVPSSPVITKVQLQGGKQAVSRGGRRGSPNDNWDSREIVQGPVNWPKELKEDHL